MDLDQTLHPVVLVVDDEILVIKALTNMLQNHGYSVLSAQNGLEALAHLKQEHIDIMIVDVMMPMDGMDGISLLRAAKSSEMKDIPVIMISGNSAEEKISQIFDLGGQDFIQKPITEKILVKKIEFFLAPRMNKLRNRKLQSALEQEQEIAKSHAKKLQEIEHLKKKVSETIETPMSVVIDTITELMQRPTKEKYRLGLITVLKCLGTLDMYKPAFLQMKDSKLDPQARELLSYFTPIGNLPPNSPILPSNRRGSESGDVFTLNHEFKQPTRDSINFDTLSMTRDELKAFVMDVFQALNVFNALSIDKLKMAAMISMVEAKYRRNPYHSFNHAVDVFQFVYSLVTDSNIGVLLTKFDQFTVLLAALFHDIDHPGLNNIYMQNSRDELTLVYNDTAILEMHHCSVAFEIMIDSKLNSDIPQWKEFRTNFIALILSTDMAQHFTMLSKFKTSKINPFSTENPTDRLELMKVILKCGDISNITKSFLLARKWAIRCIAEFHRQGDLEKEKSLPVGMLNERSGFNFPKSQIGFVDFVGGAFFVEVESVYPSLSYLTQQIEKNKAEWKSLLDQGQIEYQEKDSPILNVIRAKDLKEEQFKMNLDENCSATVETKQIPHENIEKNGSSIPYSDVNGKKDDIEKKTPSTTTENPVCPDSSGNITYISIAIIVIAILIVFIRSLLK